MQNSKSKAGSTRIDRMAVVVLSMLVTLVVAGFLVKYGAIPFIDALHTLNSTFDQAQQALGAAL